MSKTNYMTKIGLLSAIGAILMYIEFPIPMLPLFLKLDISELPAIIGAFSLGPLAAVIIELLKNLIRLLNSQTMGVGELANFLVGVAFLLPAGYIYSKKRTRIGAMISLAVGAVAMAIAGGVLNYFVFIPLYQSVLHFPLDQMIALGTAANPQIVDLTSFVTLAIVPFNILKGVVLSVLAMMLYKRVSPILH